MAKTARSGACTVGIVAPSGYLPEPVTIDRAAQVFAARGWRVQAGEMEKLALDAHDYIYDIFPAAAEKEFPAMASPGKQSA